VGERGRAGRVGRLRDALARPGISIIAEIKRGSPSAGAMADLDPLDAARAYRRGGATALSVLTEPRHFGGELDFGEVQALVDALVEQGCVQFQGETVHYARPITRR